MNEAELDLMNRLFFTIEDLYELCKHEDYYKK
jgi:hypothetical protein